MKKLSSINLFPFNILFLNISLIFFLFVNFSTLHSTEPKSIDPKEGEKDAVLFYWKSEYNELVEKKRVLSEKYNQLLIKKESRSLLSEDINGENQELQKKIKELEERTSALLTQIEASDKNAKGLEKEIASLKFSLDALNAEYSKVKEASAKDAELKSRFSALEKELAILKSQKEAAEKKLTELTALEAKIKQLESEKIVLQKSSDDSKLQLSKIEGLEAKIKQLENTISSLTAEKNKLSEDLKLTSSPPLLSLPVNSVPADYVSQLEKTILQLENEKTKVSKDLIQLKEDTIQFSNKKLVDLGKIIQERESEIKEDEEKLALIKKEETQLENDWNSYRENLAYSKILLTQNQVRIEDLEKQLIAITAELEESKKKNDDLNKELEDVRKDYDSALGDLATAQDRYNEEKNKYLEEVEKLNLEKNRLEDALEKQVKKGDISVSRRGDKLVINLKNSITFKSGSSTLHDSGKKVLDEVYQALKQYNQNKVYIEGNTDATPISSGKFKDNWYLSFARAHSVFDYLQKSKGADPQRFALASMGEYNPIRPNNSEKNKMINRRVEIIVTPFKLK